METPKTASSESRPPHSPRRLGTAALSGWLWLSVIGVSIVLTLWTWQKWDRVWVERSEAFFPPEWQNEDLSTLAWRYPIYRSNDSYQWVHLADALAHGNRFPLQHRFDEGPPEGRPNRWHSGLAYALAASGSLVAKAQDWPTARGIHYSAHWLGAVIHLCALIGGTLLISRLSSRRAALLFAGLYFFHAAIVWDFAFSRLDHEAVFQLFFLFHLIGLTGLIRRDSPSSYRWALLAGISAGFCWWVSATMMAAVSILTTLGLLAEGLHHKASETASPIYVKKLRIWGGSAAATILLFCLIDGRLFPEPSIATLHPIFILAQIGAALVCLALFARGKSRQITVFAVGLLCGISPLLWFLIHGANAHPWLDPMMRRLHDYIVEFQSPFSNGLWSQVESLQAAALGILALVVLYRIKATEYRVLTALVIGLLALSLLQTRWLGLLATTAALAVCLPQHRKEAAFIWYLGLAVLLWSAATWSHKWLTIEEKPGTIFVTDLMLQVGARDINLNLQRLSDGETLHVAMPYAYAATSALFPEIHPVGSFYWENAEGIRASADFFAGKNTDTRIDYAVVQGGRQGAPFARLTNWVAKSEDSPASIESGLAWQMSTRGKFPGWSERPFHGTFGSDQFAVRIFARD